MGRAINAALGAGVVSCITVGAYVLLALAGLLP